MMMVEMLVKMPDLRRRIHADHVADPSGHCRECTDVRWPCELHRMATEADRRCGHHGPRALPPMHRGPAAGSRFPEPRVQYGTPPPAPGMGPTIPRLAGPATHTPSHPRRRPSSPVVGPPMQRGHGHEPALPSQASVHLPTARRVEPSSLDLPAPREVTGGGQPRHLMGVLPQAPAPKQELIDVLEDVLRWSR